MILDSFKNIEFYKSISPNIGKAIEHLLKNDYSHYEAGKYELGIEEFYVMVNHYKTKNENDCKLEAHKKFIDIQLMISGNEKVGITILENQIPSEEYSDEKDVMFFKTDSELFSLKEKMFAIFFPHDIHMPGVNFEIPEEVKKVVVKVKVDL